MSNNEKAINGPIGIGVVTYNRVERLAETLKKIVENTEVDYELIISDDGSSDRTIEYLKDNNFNFISGKNKGIAWNKNRALFYLNNFSRSNHYFIIEDDTYPIEKGWEVPWIESINLWGHINFLPPWYGDKIVRGSGTPNDPYICRNLTAQVSAFNREVISYCGYYDTRFGKYGFEHADHTIRIVKAGYGGFPIVSDNQHEADFCYLSHGFAVDSSHSYYSEEHVAENGAILSQIINDEIFRPAWRGDEQMREFRKEIADALQRQKL